MKSAYISLAVALAALAFNLLNVCRHAAELPDRPVYALAWATFSWLLAMFMAWTADNCQQVLWHARARHAGPPQVWACHGAGEAIRLDVIPVGIDPEGSPAWLVVGLVQPLPRGTSVVIGGLTRHAAVYVPVDDAMIRLERNQPPSGWVPDVH